MLAAVLATGIAASSVALPNDAAPAEAAGTDVIAIVLEGTGNGHGRGMSQWGAYGWAVDHGWSWPQILDWYYGGTAMGDVDPNSRMTVRLQGMDGAESVGVVSYAGGVSWAGQTYASLRAVKNPTGPYFDVYGSGASTWCGGRLHRQQLVRVVHDGDRGGARIEPARGHRPVPARRFGRPLPRVDRRVGPPTASASSTTLRTEDYLRGVVPARGRGQLG